MRQARRKDSWSEHDSSRHTRKRHRGILLVPSLRSSVWKRREEFSGSVLDAGCGTGENALYLASRGHEVWGLDFIPVAIERADVKAQERGLNVHFQVGDALKLDQLRRTFDSVIDCGLFHTFTDEERPLYVSGLATVVRPGGSVHILCFSDNEPPGRVRGDQPEGDP